MKKILAVLWAFHLMIPLLRLSAPAPELVCAVCEANGHALCEKEGHDCSHVSAASTPESCCAGKKSGVNPSKSSMGHKCAQREVSFLVTEAERYLQPGPQKLYPPLLRKRAELSAFFLPIPDFQKQIDKPPAA